MYRVLELGREGYCVMGSVLSRLVQGTNPLVSSIVALAGGVAGGGVYLSLPGAVFGLFVALGLCALLSIAAAAAGLAGEEGVPASASVALAAATPSAANVAAEASAIIAPTESEASLMNAGRYADYHLAKAKRLFDAGLFKEAAYQASASLSHGNLAEARELREKAQTAIKT